jgi:alkylation response protein AidB-like acyl-CoA dehydrogenase
MRTMIESRGETMNFEFSDDQKGLAAQVRRLLEDKCPPAAVRAILEGAESFDRALWARLAEMGLLAITIPERYGGLGLGPLELCGVAEELGRALAPVPFSSSVYLATEFLLTAGSDAQKAQWLPKLARGEAVGTYALAETAGAVTSKSIQLQATNGGLTGAKTAVPDGDVANFAIVAARTRQGSDPSGVSLFLVDLSPPGVTRTRLESIDPSRGSAQLTFENATAELLGETGDGLRIADAVLDRAAVLTAFEQLGGAERALEMARDYALDRMAFGRQIGSFQAIKHMLADMYVSTALARSNAYYGAWALSADAPELPVAAATARVSATQAFQHCAKNNIQAHGGMGFTWAFNCHLFYRRSNLLALSLGSLSTWENKLIGRLRNRNAA